MLKLFRSKRFIQGVAVLLIVVGIYLAIGYIRGTLNAYREMEFATQNNFDAGNPDVALLEPWMNIRYIAEAYTVPQPFIFEALNIPMERASSELPLGRLNNRLDLGDDDDDAAIVERLRQIILDYRRNPVVTGLGERRVKPWMNMQYIANSTGIPVETLFAEIGIPVDGYAFMPLNRLVEQSGYEQGPGHLIDTLQRLVDDHEGGQRGH